MALLRDVLHVVHRLLDEGAAVPLAEGERVAPEAVDVLLGQEHRQLGERVAEHDGAVTHVEELGACGSFISQVRRIYIRFWKILPILW